MELSEDLCFPNCLNLIQKDETFGKKTLKSRNQIFHTYKVSVKLLQNRYTISLLKNKLRQWNKIADEKQQVYKKLIIKSPVKANSELPRNINILVKPFCTSFCCIPKNILQENLHNFLIYVKLNIKSNTEPPQERKVSTVFSIKPKDDKLCHGNNITVNNNSQDVKPKIGDFMTARELNSQNNIRNKAKEASVGLQKRKSGLRRGLTNQFVSPLLSNLENSEKNTVKENEKEIDDRLKNIDPQMVELIRSEIMEINEKITWEDIAGLNSAKNAIQEAVVWPLLRPDIFKGLRRPPKGILLFGPPGTGKTLIGKCVASQSKSTFFSISASSITSKWIGDGEKMVRALFAVAQCHQPAVIFIDEVDSLLSQRSETEHESSRRIKTEFLVQLDGATTESDDRILLIGATNRPQELDEAARRRFTRRLYIPLPDNQARIDLLQKLLSKERHVLSDENFREIAKMADGFSGADLRNLCSEAALEPIRSIDVHDFDRIDVTEVRPIAIEDFLKSFSIIRASVSSKDLDQYIQWDKTYGSGNAT